MKFLIFMKKIAAGAVMFCVFALGAGTIVQAQTYYYMPSAIPPVYNSYDYDYGYNDNYYQYPDHYYDLNVRCYPSVSSAVVGQTVTWVAQVSGGAGYYSYDWSGTNNLNGHSKTVSKTYSTDGTKRASVTVRSGGEVDTANCGSVEVDDYYYPGYPYPSYPGYQVPVYNQPVSYPVSSSRYDLDIGCYADPAKPKINQPVTWVAEVVGGAAPYTYSWTGTDGLTGNARTAIKYYATAGSKSAIVTVTSADGRTGSRACSNQAVVASAYKAPVKTASTPVVQNNDTAKTVITPTTATGSTQAASSLFSLAYVPWGWVAILVILVLFATVLYLLFNRQKI